MLQADVSGSPDEVTSASAAAKLVEYEVTAYTSDISGAGTAGDVFVALAGANGSIGERCMQGGRGSFERNKKYVFRFQVGLGIVAQQQACDCWFMVAVCDAQALSNIFTLSITA